MHEKPQKEHEWLHRLVGTWSYEHECPPGPDQPSQKYRGTETVRSLGGLWVIAEAEGDGPGGGTATSIITFGYSLLKKRFVGTFIASIMTYLWNYDGGLDDAGKVLTLEAEGPSFTGDGQIVKYQDIIEFVSDDHRTMTSRTLGDDGKWHEFMVIHYRRMK
jgi:hypothetical protein